MSEQSPPKPRHAWLVVGPDELYTEHGYNPLEKVDKLKSALLTAVDLIRTWHNLSFNGNGPLAETAWQAYEQSEEMREIREAMK